VFDEHIDLLRLGVQFHVSNELRSRKAKKPIVEFSLAHPDPPLRRSLPDPQKTRMDQRSTFSMIRLRHRRTKASGSRKASLTMMFMLAQSASRRWRRLNGHAQIVLLLEGKVFADVVLQNAA
jgi:hypothetical protein